MSTNKHTPGEWRASGDAIINGKGTICVLWKPDKFTGGSRKANARLIAAAPMLLEACKALLELTYSRNTTLVEAASDQAEAAIAKAESKP